MGEVVPFPVARAPADIVPIDRVGVVGGIEVLTALVHEPTLDGPAVAVMVLVLDGDWRTVAAYTMSTFPDSVQGRQVAHEFAVCTLKGLAVAHVVWQQQDGPPAAG